MVDTNAANVYNFRDKVTQLKVMELGYTFDQLFGAKIGGRVYATASNVFTITNYKGIDPEVSGGIDNSLYPRPFSALVGLSLNF